MRLTFLFLTLSFFSFSQLNQVDTKGRKQGKWEKTYPDSRVYMYRGQFKDDKPTGKFVYFYESTKLKAVINHNALKVGRSVAIYYHENGNTMSYGIYNNMKKDSIWTNFTPSQRLSNTETYKNGKLNGVKKIYYTPDDPNDKSQLLSTTMTYKDDLLHGQYMEYFMSQKVKMKGKYVDNKQHGAWEEFHPNGKRSHLYRYQNGVKHGYAIAYDIYEKRIAEVMFYYGDRIEGEKLEKLLEQLKKAGINPNTMKKQAN